MACPTGEPLPQVTCFSDKVDRPAGLVARRIEPEPSQELEDMERIRPVLGDHGRPPHVPSGAWSASSRAPHPSVAIRDRSAATTSAGSSVRSRITCQRIDGSASSSQSRTVIGQ